MNEQSKPLKIKIFAAISLFLFAVSIVISIIIGTTHSGLSREYENLHRRQVEMEQGILEQNMAYYEMVLKNGVYGLQNGAAIMYKALKGLYRYRVYVNGKLVTGSSVSIIKPECEIIVEEYYVPGATSQVPYSVLREFSYFKNKGQGGDALPLDEIFNERQFRIMYPNFWEVEMTRIDDGALHYNRIKIEVSEMTNGNEFEFDFGYEDEFIDKFGLNTNTIAIRYV